MRIWFTGKNGDNQGPFDSVDFYKTFANRNVHEGCGNAKDRSRVNWCG